MTWMWATRIYRLAIPIRVTICLMVVVAFAKWLKLPPPTQSCLLALVDKRLKEALEQLDTIAFTNTRETRMIGEGFIEIVTDIPAHAELVSSQNHQLPFGADAVKEHHELQLEKDHRINRGATSLRIGLFDQVAHKRQIHRAHVLTPVTLESRMPPSA